MAHGGKRPSAGRKPGAPNKRTADTIAKAEATGLLPHEFLLAVTRGETIDGHTPTFDERKDAAKAAAPYFAPKLASLEHAGPNGQPLQPPTITIVRDADPAQ